MTASTGARRGRSMKSMELRRSSPEPLSPEYVRDRHWVRRNLRDLVGQYPDEWIAVVGEQVIAHGPDQGEVVREAERLQSDAEPVILRANATVRVYAHQPLV